MDGSIPIDLRSAIAVGDLRSSASSRLSLDAQRDADEGRAGEAAKKFEALLATQLVKELRRGLSDGFFGSGAGADVFDGWLDEHLGTALAKSGALDLESAVRIGIEHKREMREAGGPGT